MDVCGKLFISPRNEVDFGCQLSEVLTVVTGLGAFNLPPLSSTDRVGRYRRGQSEPRVAANHVDQQPGGLTVPDRVELSAQALSAAVDEDPTATLSLDDIPAIPDFPDDFPEESAPPRYTGITAGGDDSGPDQLQISVDAVRAFAEQADTVQADEGPSGPVEGPAFGP